MVVLVGAQKNEACQCVGKLRFSIANQLSERKVIPAGLLVAFD